MIGKLHEENQGTCYSLRLNQSRGACNSQVIINRHVWSAVPAHHEVSVHICVGDKLTTK
jgi:hypothetical protein